MHGSNVHLIQHFLGTLPHPAVSRQYNSQVIRKLHSFGSGKHILQIQAIDSPGNGETSRALAPCSNTVVRSNQSCPPAKTNNSSAARSLEQFIINETDAFLQYFREQICIVGLQFVRVAEKEIRLVCNQFLSIHLFHSNEHITITQIFLHLQPHGCIFRISNSPHRTGLNGYIQFRETLLKEHTLVWSQRHTLVRRRFAFPKNAQSQGVF